jgi:hypothetical protein
MARGVTPSVAPLVRFFLHPPRRLLLHGQAAVWAGAVRHSLAIVPRTPILVFPDVSREVPALHGSPLPIRAAESGDLRVTAASLLLRKTLRHAGSTI